MNFVMMSMRTVGNNKFRQFVIFYRRVFVHFYFKYTIVKHAVHVSTNESNFLPTTVDG